MSTKPVLPQQISWPQGHRFAFTVVDDTDGANVHNVKPVYDLLARLGMRTTKLVWMFQGESNATLHGSSCDDLAYLAWVLSLQQQGFEIGFHNAAPVTSLRARTCQALERFRALFGPQPLIHCNHTGCLEGVHWGDARLSGWRRPLYNLLTRGRRRGLFRGHIAGDPLFWGDLCQAQVRYVRNFVFDALNTFAMCPEMPYHDPAKPYVNFWFASTEGPTLRSFLRHFKVRNIDQLVAEGGLASPTSTLPRALRQTGGSMPSFASAWNISPPKMAGLPRCRRCWTSCAKTRALPNESFPRQDCGNWSCAGC